MKRPDLKTPHREKNKKLALGQTEADCSRAAVATYNRRKPAHKDTMTKAAKPSPTGKYTPPLPASYEDAVQELEQLVARMESGQMPLADMLLSYQRGAFLLSHCRELVQAVEGQIQVLEAGTLKNWSGSAE